MLLIKGNKYTLTIAITDDAGAVLTNLGTATDVFFMVKKCIDDADIDALISKSLLGGGITIDTPITGSIQVVLDSNDTNITALSPKGYPVGVKIVYSATDKQSIDLSDETSEEVNKIFFESSVIDG